MNNKLVLNFILILLVLINLLQAFNVFSNYMYIIWSIIILLCFVLKDNHKRYYDKNEKIKSVIILVVTYEIVYVLFGLILGYKKSPYSLKFFEIIKNLFKVFGSAIVIEFIRTKLIKNSDSIYLYVFSIILFIGIKLDYEEIINYTYLREYIVFFLEDVVIISIESVILTFLSFYGGYLLNFAYTIPINITLVILPVFPDIDWFTNSSLKLMLFLFIFLVVIYEENRKFQSRKQIKKESPIKVLPYLTFLAFFVLFVAGFLPYKPVAIVSNSMVPSFARGDVCVVEKVEKYKRVLEIEEGDVIEYQLNDIYIIHRVIDIENLAYGRRFITKGDNNRERDLLPVEEEQVVGIVDYVIPYLGYPSVLFSELLSRK